MKINTICAGIVIAAWVLPGMAIASSNGLGTLYGAGLSQCLNELSLLQPLNREIHQMRAQALNTEVGKATTYLLMRERLESDVQLAMDKQHQANLDRECRQVHNALFTLLLNHSVTPVRLLRSAP